MGIKFWGYPKRADEAVELSEVTLMASPKQLREIAAFLLYAAEDIERHGINWEHEHLSDKAKGFRSSPSFIVFNSQHFKKSK